MERYVCIHGHFYQPPRENAWLESIQLQDSAYPYHDWNERITAECYAPNAVSRILDSDNRITEIVNDYARISFNFGPTLLAWLETNAPDVYGAILEADRESQQRFSGHGSAIAQAYNHVIMPLANRRDKYTQVVWGIRDFQHRFGRDPEGMWLPETAVDLETLDVLAELGIKFTILSPRQAQRVRSTGSPEWQDVSNGDIDPTTAYLLRLPSGRTISLFFYDDPIARAVAFEGLLSSGEQFVRRLSQAFSDDRERPQLVHIATDGETYGHHHRHGDMALAYALDHIQSSGLASITNYAEYLERHPPTHDVEIIENTSWSCVHGVERWRSDCGCNSGRHPTWNQAWRAPLREALDWLRGTLEPQFEDRAGQLFRDPWEARNEYIHVILDRSSENVKAFLKKHTIRTLDDTTEIVALKLMELQRHLMLMYTSCGWFFDELSGVETIAVIQHAGRAIQLAEGLFGNATESGFLELLERAKSNVRTHGDGRRIYEKFVKPAMVDLTWVAAHYAVSSLFEEYGSETRIHCYQVSLEDYQTAEAGRARLAVGRARVFSEITHESARLNFGVLHFGDHNLNAGVQEYVDEEAYEAMLSDLTQSFSTAEFPEVIRHMDRYLGSSVYSLRFLFKDEQRKVLTRILESTLTEVEAAYRQVYDLHYPLILFLTDLGNPLPRAFQGIAEFILNVDLRGELSVDAPDADRVRSLLDAAEGWEVELDTKGLGYVFGQTLESMIEALSSSADDLQLLEQVTAAIQLAQSMPFDINLWKVQNVYWTMLKSVYPELKVKASQGDKIAREWTARFASLGEHLSIRVS